MAAMQFFVDEDIGPNRSITPQGFLLCLNVPLARTGIQNYAPGEIPVRPKNGYIQIERTADEVFSPQSLATYSAAPFVDGHGDVDTSNWRARAGGVVLNARRGDGALSECVIGDILVTTPEMIELVQSGKRQVSVGYVCAYDEFEPGRGRQRDIIVNHVALVEKGRCGELCSIGDQQTEIPAMTAPAAKSGSIIKRSLAALRSAVATRDEAAIEKALTGAEAVTELAELDTASVVPAPSGGVTINLTRDEFPPKKKDDDETEEEKKKRLAKEKTDDEGGELEARVAALETGIGEIKTMLQTLTTAKGPNETVVTDEKILGELKQEAPPGTNDAAMTNDSAFLAFSHQETVALGEILAPGIVPPAFDAKLPPTKTFDSICKHRRAALAVAHTQAPMHKFVADGLQGKTFDTLTCGETRQLFKAAAAVKTAINNGSTRTADVAVVGTGTKVGKVASIADLNKLGKERYKTNH